MKHTKGLLAALLALALALSLALPTMAAVDWSDFRITTQPQSKTIKYGDSFTLSVKVHVPDGVEVEYQWEHSNKIEGATTSILTLGPDDRYYPEYDRLGGASTDFICWITAYERDSDGHEISKRYLMSDRVHVTTERTALGKFLDVTIAPFGYAFTMTMMSPAFALIFPISYLGCLVYCYIEGFKGLFS
ncbi:MAG: hypothetical protein LBB75_04410 [Oscillospiraceae bacterium]|nr:hypothetical protein [Oscillospiraceae bacterium]